MTKKSRDAETIGALYDEFGDYYHESRKDAAGRFANDYIDLPTLTSMLPDDLTHCRVLDAGCGPGMVSELLARRGAQVEGIDASSRMIDIARSEKPPESDTRYSVGDVEALPFHDGDFDLIICNYVLENVGAVDKVFREFRRVLRIQGRCVFSISHPLRALTSKSATDGEEVWILRDYFDRSVRHSDFGGGMVVPKYRRTMGDYADAIVAAGFLIRRLVEPRPAAAAARFHPDAYGTAMRLPQLLAMELVPTP